MIGHVCVHFALITYKNRIRGLKVNIGIIFPTLSFDLQGCKGGTVICSWIYVAEEGLELSRVLIQGQEKTASSPILLPAEAQIRGQGAKFKLI